MHKAVHLHAFPLPFAVNEINMIVRVATTKTGQMKSSAIFVKH